MVFSVFAYIRERIDTKGNKNAFSVFIYLAEAFVLKMIFRW